MGRKKDFMAQLQEWSTFGLLAGAWLALWWLCLRGGGRSAWFLLYTVGGLLLYVLIHYGLALQKVEVVRRVRTGKAGQDEFADVRVELRVASPWPLPWLVVRETWRRFDSGYVTFQKLILGGLRRRVTYIYRIPARLRGEYASAAVQVMTADIFGILTKTKIVASPAAFLVPPKPARVFPLPVSAAAGERAAVQVPLPAPREPADQFLIREYRSGDPLHRIHWKASARRDEWVAKAEDVPAEERWLLVLDRHFADPSSLEMAARVCAGYVAWLRKRRCRFGLAGLRGDESAGQVLVAGVYQDANAAESWLARWQPGREDLGDTGADGDRFDDFRAAVGRISGIVWITSRLEAREMIETLCRLRHGGVRTVIAYIDREKVFSPATVNHIPMLEQAGMKVHRYPVTELTAEEEVMVDGA